MRLLMEQAYILREGRLPPQPLMPIVWWFDFLMTGEAPCSLWELPADIADEIRYVNGIVRKPQSG